MSNYSVLKQDINNNIYENQTQQITGTVLNAILNEMTASLGAGYQFAGVATLGMNPGDPDQRVFYLAGEGIYTSFGGIQVPAGKLGVLKWDNRWTLQTIDGLGGGGANLTGYVSVASTDDLPDEGQPTIGYLCGTNLYLYVGEGGDTKEGKYQDCGSFRGPQGDSVQDVEQTQTSLENGGVNKIKFTLSNGISCEFQVRNGTTSSGLFPTLAALQAAYPSPVVGQYAFVGAGFPADIYVCTTAGTWTDSGEDYDGDNVDLTDYATKAELNQLEAEVDGGSYTGHNLYIFSVNPGDYFCAITETKCSIYVGPDENNFTYIGDRPDNSLNAFFYIVPTGVYKIRLYSSSGNFDVDVVRNKYYYRFISDLAGIDQKFIEELDGVEKSGATNYIYNVQPGNLFVAISEDPFYVYAGPTDESVSLVGEKTNNLMDAFIYEVPSNTYKVKLYKNGGNLSVKVLVDAKGLFDIYRGCLRVNDEIKYLKEKKVDAGMFYGSAGPTNILYTYPSVFGYLDSGGNIKSNNAYKTSDFIEVLPGTTYALSYIRFSLQYDANKRQKSASYTDHNNASSATITTGADIRYIRVTYSTGNEGKAQVVKGNTVPTYSDYSVLVPFLRVLFKNVEDVSVPIENIAGAVPSTNLFDRDNVVSGYLDSQGSITANNNYRTSLFIPVNPSAKYSFAFARFIVEYDAAKVMVPNTYTDKNHAASSSITTSATTKFLRVTYSTGNLYKAQMAVGETLPPYESYGFTLPSVSYPKSKYQGKKMVCFGDSITACVAEQDIQNWCMYFKNATGVEPINQGYWSGRVAYSENTDAVRNSFSFCALVDSIISGDWSAQDIIYETPGYEGHAQQLDKLKQIDFNEVDFVSIALGTNDLSSDTPFETENEPMSQYSVNGAFRYTISKLLTNYPHLQIFIMTPVYRFDPSTGNDVLVNGRGIQDFVDDYKELGNELRIPVCNMFNDIGVNKYNREYYWGENGGDGLHPIATMKRVMGNKVAGFLISTY